MVEMAPTIFKKFLSRLKRLKKQDKYANNVKNFINVNMRLSTDWSTLRVHSVGKNLALLFFSRPTPIGGREIHIG